MIVVASTCMLAARSLREVCHEVDLFAVCPLTKGRCFFKPSVAYEIVFQQYEKRKPTSLVYRGVPAMR